MREEFLLGKYHLNIIHILITYIDSLEPLVIFKGIPLVAQTKLKREFLVVRFQRETQQIIFQLRGKYTKHSSSTHAKKIKAK